MSGEARYTIAGAGGGVVVVAPLRGWLVEFCGANFIKTSGFFGETFFAKFVPFI